MCNVLLHIEKSPLHPTFTQEGEDFCHILNHYTLCDFNNEVFAFQYLFLI